MRIGLHEFAKNVDGNIPDLLSFGRATSSAVGYHMQ